MSLLAATICPPRTFPLAQPKEGDLSHVRDDRNNFFYPGQLIAVKEGHHPRLFGQIIRIYPTPRQPERIRADVRLLDLRTIKLGFEFGHVWTNLGIAQLSPLERAEQEQYAAQFEIC
jgi:hypothetical protein